ncbi:deoxyhypusine synthase family protein [Blattabacterium cuenoti]|uniref:deoxyhypusine synthase family protein n=1 Tax=Blattabacterium cuenoti TaxID=1653831 RepID=UPI00163C529D|nr:deoxyhypusine synthase family protein [Blattabacterium cuenoti]
MKNSITSFIKKYFLHFNALSLYEAAKAYKNHIQNNGKMMITIAGAMSTAELGKILSKMIRKNKVHIISCTGANLEEDIINLIAHSHYKKISNYRYLTPDEEKKFFKKGFYRITDTLIPEKQAFKKLQKHIIYLWKRAQQKSQRYFPHEYIYQLLLENILEPYYNINSKDSWVLEAAKKNIPIVVPGWEDSTIGNIFTSFCIKKIFLPSIVKNGIEYMMYLAKWYKQETINNNNKIGFFQIGGGISGDFPICVVPMLSQDIGLDKTPFWSYFCQVSDSTTSYGSYSGAIPNEKITWGKVDKNTPKFIIESDATIVVPLIFAYILNM